MAPVVDDLRLKLKVEVVLCFVFLSLIYDKLSNFMQKLISTIFSGERRKTKNAQLV
jgi:hypothetical protein